MTRIDQIRADLRLAKRLKVIQDLEVDQAGRKLREATNERDKVVADMERLLQELWATQIPGYFP